MEFKGVLIAQGDIISVDMAVRIMPMTKFAAAVLDVKENRLHVGSTLLRVFFGEDYIFTEEEIRKIEVISTADAATKEYTEGRFEHGQTVVGLVRDSDNQIQGKLVAAYDPVNNTCAIQTQDGKFFFCDLAKVNAQ